MTNESMYEFGERVCKIYNFALLLGLTAGAQRSGDAMRGTCLKCGAVGTLFAPLDRGMFYCFTCKWHGTMVDYCCELFGEPRRDAMIGVLAVLVNVQLPPLIRQRLEEIDPLHRAKGGAK